MDLIWAIVLAVVMGLAGLFTGDKLSDAHHERLPPKYEITYNITDVKSRTEVVVRSEQGQWTAVISVLGQTNKSFWNYQINAHTNISFSHEAVTNRHVRTNAERILKSLNIPKIQFPK